MFNTHESGSTFPGSGSADQNEADPKHWISQLYNLQLQPVYNYDECTIQCTVQMNYAQWMYIEHLHRTFTYCTMYNYLG